MARSGPLPSPDDLAAYERTHPGAAGAIIEMARSQQQHRQSLECRFQEADIAHREQVIALQSSNSTKVLISDLVGQICGFIVAAGCVAGALYALYERAHPAVIAIFLGLPVAAIVKAVRERLKSEK